MADLDLQQTVPLRVQRCYKCGRWFAYEPIGGYRCPLCAGARIEELEAEAAKNQRAMASLRGAVTKARKRR